MFAASTLLRVGRTFDYELPVLQPGLVIATAGALVAIVAATVLPQALRSLRISPLSVLRD